MKKFKFMMLLLATMFVFSCNVEAKKVPSQVKNCFSRIFPDVKDVDWAEEDNEWEAEFEQKGVKCSATFYESGKFNEKEISIVFDSLPQDAKDYITRTYPGKQKDIEDLVEVTKADGTVGYEVDIDNQELSFNMAGMLLQKKNEGKD